MTQPILFSRAGFPAQSVASDPVPRFLSGTSLATPDGPRTIETLAVGDTVTTREGPRRIARLGGRVVTREDWAYRREIWPVRVPVGSLGNPRPIRAAQDQRVLLWGPTVERMCGVGEMTVTLGELVGLRGLSVERPLGDLRYFGLGLGIAAVVEVEGAFCEIGTEPGEAVPRETLRAAFLEMHVAGEPPLRGVEV